MSTPQNWNDIMAYSGLEVPDGSDGVSRRVDTVAQPVLAVKRPNTVVNMRKQGGEKKAKVHDKKDSKPVVELDDAMKNQYGSLVFELPAHILTRLPRSCDGEEWEAWLAERKQRYPKKKATALIDYSESSGSDSDSDEEPVELPYSKAAATEKFQLKQHIERNTSHLKRNPFKALLHPEANPRQQGGRKSQSLAHDLLSTEQQKESNAILQMLRYQQSELFHKD